VRERAITHGRRLVRSGIFIAYKGAKGAKGVTRSKAAAQKLAEELKVKAGATDFAELAKQFSDDEASRERLGSVGTVTKDNKVKPFADAVFALKVDQVSDVVESEFGFHIIKRNQ
jgi:peptidyl-prolyl cis-trans isomerase NIMA-interacting 1